MKQVILALFVLVCQALAKDEFSRPQLDEKDFLSRNLTKGNLENKLKGTNTYSQAVYYGQTHPTRDGGSWSGWCASLMWRSGNLPEASACPSAIECYYRSHIISHDVMSAPSGAYHWWDIGSDGHVAMATTNGWAMMASCHVTESWGNCIGVTSVSSYTSSVGATYLGWSYDYAGAEIADVHSNTPSNTIPQSNTVNTGTPDSAYYMRQQVYASHYGYTGPIDGVLGQNSWAGTQRGLRNYGYTGPDDGVPGTNTYMAMQRLASHWGYTGPIDGELGPNSYKGLARYFNTL
ncbi:hypothetical protein EON65_30730 [archaeon]|nr:MAG: hypothetical protein EON65_30730 [archaeon]